MPLPRRRSTRTSRPPSSPRPLRSRLRASRRNSRSGRSMGSPRVQSKLPSADTELSSSSLRSARLRRCSTSQLPSTRQGRRANWNRHPAAPRHSDGTTPPRASARRAGDGTRHPPPPPGRRPVPARRRAQRSSVAVPGGRRRAPQGTHGYWENAPRARRTLPAAAARAAATDAGAAARTVARAAAAALRQRLDRAAGQPAGRPRRAADAVDSPPATANPGCPVTGAGVAPVGSLPAAPRHAPALGPRDRWRGSAGVHRAGASGPAPASRSRHSPAAAGRRGNTARHRLPELRAEPGCRLRGTRRGRPARASAIRPGLRRSDRRPSPGRRLQRQAASAPLQLVERQRRAASRRSST